MRTRIDRIISESISGREVIGSVYDDLTGIIIEEHGELMLTGGDHPGSGPRNRDLLEQCLKLFDREFVRYQMSILEITSWRNALLPMEGFLEAGRRYRKVWFREYSYSPRCGGRIDDMEGRRDDSAIGSAFIAKDEMTLVVPAVLESHFNNSGAGVRDLPAGTVLTGDINLDDFGTISSAVIEGDHEDRRPVEASYEKISEVERVPDKKPETQRDVKTKPKVKRIVKPKSAARSGVRSSRGSRLKSKTTGKKKVKNKPKAESRQAAAKGKKTKQKSGSVSKHRKK